METNKRIVLDANILIRAVLGKKVRNLLETYAANVQFFTPEICYHDTEKYLPVLLEKRGLPAAAALEVLEKLKCLVNIVEPGLYSLYEIEAKQRISVRDMDDWHIVAISLMLNCPIWTEDADFFGAGVATWTSDRVHIYLSS